MDLWLHIPVLFAVIIKSSKTPFIINWNYSSCPQRTEKPTTNWGLSLWSIESTLVTRGLNSLVSSLVLQYRSSVPLNTSTLKYFWNLDRNIHKTGLLFICSTQLIPCCDTGWWAYNDSSPKYLIMINDSKLVFWVIHWYYLVIIISEVAFYHYLPLEKV